MKEYASSSYVQHKEKKLSQPYTENCPRLEMFHFVMDFPSPFPLHTKERQVYFRDMIYTKMSIAELSKKSQIVNIAIRSSLKTTTVHESAKHNGE